MAVTRSESGMWQSRSALYDVTYDLQRRGS